MENKWYEIGTNNPLLRKYDLEELEKENKKLDHISRRINVKSQFKKYKVTRKMYIDYVKDTYGDVICYKTVSKLINLNWEKIPVLDKIKILAFIKIAQILEK